MPRGGLHDTVIFNNDFHNKVGVYQPMNYYVMQVRTRAERRFIKLAEAVVEYRPLRLVHPERKLSIRRAGRTVETLAAIFPGYVFLESEELPTELYWELRRVPGFFQFLKENTDVQPLAGEDKRLLLHFLSFGEVIEKSRVRFDEDSRIRVLEGPLSGLEGRIVKVNRRKGRAKVSLDLYGDTFLVDLGFETLEEGENGIAS